MKINTDLTKVLLSKYINKWVALTPQQTEVIAAAKSPGLVLKAARRKKIRNPVITFVVKDYGFLVP